MISNQERRLERWAEHFRLHFSNYQQPQPDTHLSTLPISVWTVSNEPPTETEVSDAIKRLKLRRAAGPDDLPPVLFKTGSPTLMRVITQLFKSIWQSESVQESWGESTVIPIFKKGRTVCENCRGISLTPVITKLLTSIILHRLTLVRENQIREQQAGFRPGRGCINHIFTLRQYLEHRNILCRPTIAVFLVLKAAFDSLNRKTLFDLMLRQGTPPKYVSIMKALYSHTTGRV